MPPGKGVTHDRSIPERSRYGWWAEQFIAALVLTCSAAPVGIVTCQPGTATVAASLITMAIHMWQTSSGGSTAVTQVVTRQFSPTAHAEVTTDTCRVSRHVGLVLLWSVPARALFLSGQRRCEHSLVFPTDTCLSVRGVARRWCSPGDERGGADEIREDRELPAELGG